MLLSCILLMPATRLAALLFTIHPIHVEAVASIVGRADCLCGFFFFNALTCCTYSVRIDSRFQSWGMFGKS
jgi:hypothetical protein